MRIHPVHSAAHRLSGTKHLLHCPGEFLGHGSRRHYTGGGNDVIHGDVAAVLDVLDLLAVPWRLLQGLDDEGSSRGNDRAGGLPVLDPQLDSHLESLPVGSSLSNVISNLLGRQASGPTLGASELVAPTSPPTALR